MNVPITCQLIEYHGSENVSVISNISNIIQLIEEIYPEADVLTVKHKSLRPYDLYKQKLFYRDKLNSIKNSNIYFFFVAYGILESYAIKILSNKNNIFYKRLVDTPNFKLPNSIKAKL